MNALLGKAKMTQPHVGYQSTFLSLPHPSSIQICQAGWFTPCHRREDSWDGREVERVILGHLPVPWCEELTHLERPWCWERLKAGREGDDRGWDGWLASLTQWTRVCINSRSWWWTGRPIVLQLMGLQRVGDDWATELRLSIYYFCFKQSSLNFYKTLRSIIKTQGWIKRCQCPSH